MPVTAAVADSPTRSGWSTAPLAGARTLVRFLLRRDRIRLPAWIVGLGLFVVYIGSALPTIAPTEKDLVSMVTLFTEPVGRMFTGPAFGMDAPTYERFFAAGYAPYLVILAALMNIMLITRHTRGDEQSGRAELLRANVTGRYAALTAALTVAVVADVLAFGVVTVLAVAAGFSVTGSVLIGLGAGLTGIAFAGVTAVTVQLSENSRTAAGFAGAVLGAAFVLRALGDMVAVGGSALSWVSPLGWSAQTAPYVQDRWTPLLLPLGLTVVATAVAFRLQARRDFGASLIAARPGPAHASAAFGTPLGLAARLQRAGFLGWGCGIVLLGIVDGAFTQALIDAGQDMPPALRDVLGHGGLVSAYLSFLGSFVIVLVAAYAVSAMQTLRAEETSGRGDTVLATPTSRVAWLCSHVAVVGLGAALIAVVAGIGTGIAAALVTGDWSLVGETLAAHVGLVPGALLVLGAAALLGGWMPRVLAPVCWAIVTLGGIVTFFADLLDLPGWLVRLSPFAHLAQVPREDFAVAPFLVLIGLAIAVTAAGCLGIRRRQINLR